ncbi:PAS domain-containing sensor histidine kinase [Mucilaginibacter segetis]|uniref:histidine kinase n=1 Tax=Mucilaginibacter segetis TaxID=2793071 RepID=A0A934ULS6_9SPHI|nr:PAS domain-containing sensor histidine kinase [Mucilaginibacter segetis]MBK0378684.1 PAS domain S-box protein [Mucilaginibacter segetis]
MANTSLNTAPALNDVFNLELFFELSPDLLCIAGYDGYFKRINPTVSKVLGYTNKELFAKPISEFIYHEDRVLTAKYRDVLIRNKPLLNFENRYVTKSGQIVWLSWTSMPFESEKVVFAIAKNITHKKMLEEDRDALLAKYTKINNDLKQLTYTTSHDLRAPVNNLLSVFSVMDVSKIQDKETLLFIDMLKHATENLKQTLNNYIDELSEKDILRINTVEIDLEKCLEFVIGSLQSLIQNSNTIINFDFSEQKIIKFNKAYLESIFLNLITNSIKYAKPGSFPIIYISSRRMNGVVQLIVEDEGIGFDMDKVKGRIFGLNQKFSNNSDSKGIGLYLVYNYVISLGGHIEIESKINEGARFIMSFKD